MLYNASHHANEWICTPVLMKFAEELCQAYVTDGTLFDQSAADILSYADIHLIPAVNPDGMDLVTGELQNGEFYRQAQNIAADYPRFPFPSGWKANIRGVDLNLQYPAGWEQARENKYALGIRSPAPADYVGSAPLTAPESRAMYDYTLALAPALTSRCTRRARLSTGDTSTMSRRSHAASGRYSLRPRAIRLRRRRLPQALPDTRTGSSRAFDRPGYTIEAGLGTNPLPTYQFPDIYELPRNPRLRRTCNVIIKNSPAGHPPGSWNFMEFRQARAP